MIVQKIKTKNRELRLNSFGSLFFLIFIIFILNINVTLGVNVKSKNMNEFAGFNPLVESSPEQALAYYENNNLELPDNKYFAAHFGTKKSIKPVVKNKKLLPVKIVPKTKQILPKFSTEKPEEIIGQSAYEWPRRDSTIPDQLEKADNFPGKQTFLQELEKLNINNEDKAFLTKLAEKESSFRPNIKNKLGYLGYYQFGDSALQTIGKSRKDFKNPEIQHEAALKLADLNLIPLKKYIGKTVNGITLTKNNLRAAAHLAGATGTKDWIEGTKKSDFAKRGFVDANGTHITKYLKEFVI